MYYHWMFHLTLPKVLTLIVMAVVIWHVESVQQRKDMQQSRCDAPKNEAQYVEQSDEFRLFHDLMRHYDRDVRPMKNASHPVVVRLGITLTQIFDLDEKNQVLTTSVWLDMEWIDDYLTWEPAEYGNIKVIRIPCERIWLPDVVLYNNADDYTLGFMKSKAMVTPDGNVFWPPPTKLRSKCPVDVTYFPFDHQTCILKLGSWIYDGFQVDVTNRSTEVDMSNYVPNGEWELVETKVKRNVVRYPCCPETFPDVTITIVIRRRTLYYISNVVLPCMMMSALTLLVFRLPPDAGEKIALGFTVLLAFSVFMLTVAEKMPETSTSVPLIGMYLTAVMAITTISIMMTVVVLNFHYRGPSKKPAPDWLRKLLLGKIGSFFCADILDVVSSTESSSTHSSIRHRRNKQTTNFPSISLVDHHGESLNSLGNHSSPTPSSSMIGRRFHSKSSSCYGRMSGFESDRAANVSCGYHQEILLILRSMADKEERELLKMDVVNEWRQMAVVIDRLLFWVFLVAIVVSSVVFLLVVPALRQDNEWPSNDDQSVSY